MLESDVEEARRKERNRESAKRSRELARQHVTMLEQTVALLAHDSQALLNRLAHLEALGRKKCIFNSTPGASACDSPICDRECRSECAIDEEPRRSGRRRARSAHEPIPAADAYPLAPSSANSRTVQLLPLQGTVVPCPSVLSLLTRS